MRNNAGIRFYAERTAGFCADFFNVSYDWYVLVLRRYSMIGDTLAHASLAGVAVGLLVKVNPIISAFAVTSVFAVLIEVLRQRFRRYAELILVIILSLSVGIAITIISSGMVHTNVEAFLFGSILTVTPDDVLAVAVLCVVSLAAVYFCIRSWLCWPLMRTVPKLPA